MEGLSYATKTVVTDALETGAATARGYYSPQLRTAYVVTTPAAHYCHITSTEHDRIATPGYEYTVEVDIDSVSLSNDDIVRGFPALPPQDRESIRSAIGNAGLLHAPHYSSFSVVFAYEHNEDREHSLFVPDIDIAYVEWDDPLLRLTFAERLTVQISETTVTTERVATSSGEFVEHVGEDHGTVLGDLTPRQHQIVTQAIEDGYSECEPYSASFIDLLDHLSMGERAIVPLVRYDADWYFSHISS